MAIVYCVFSCLVIAVFLYLAGSHIILGPPEFTNCAELQESSFSLAALVHQPFLPGCAESPKSNFPILMALLLAYRRTSNLISLLAPSKSFFSLLLYLFRTLSPQCNSSLDPPGSPFYDALIFAPSSPLNVVQSCSLDPSASAFCASLLSALLFPAHGELSLSLVYVIGSLATLSLIYVVGSPLSPSVGEIHGGCMMTSVCKPASMKRR